MNPKEKANELVSKLKEVNEDYIDSYQSIPCALILVDEILDCVLPSCEFGGEINNHTIEYWQEVKQEIEKL